MKSYVIGVWEGWVHESVGDGGGWGVGGRVGVVVSGADLGGVCTAPPMALVLRDKQGFAFFDTCLSIEQPSSL